MNLFRHRSLIKFDRQFPVYNFFFPAQGKERSDSTLSAILENANDFSRLRALYFHIPFCETICNFCPFTRGLYPDRSVIDRYFEDLLSEIRIKAQLVDLKQIPISSIFFGGGTPSLLDPDQIRRIGELIHSTFDTSRVREFSFEIEVKSLTVERAQAMRSIGVTHPRFGLQTFSPAWRKRFDLTASLEQIEQAAQLLKVIFPFQTFDILYGASGQDEEELIADLEAAVAMGTTNIDIYPIDNIMTQVGLHARLEQENLTPTSAMRKFSMNVLIDQFMATRGLHASQRTWLCQDPARYHRGKQRLVVRVSRACVRLSRPGPSRLWHQRGQLNEGACRYEHPQQKNLSRADCTRANRLRGQRTRSGAGLLAPSGSQTPLSRTSGQAAGAVARG